MGVMGISNGVKCKSCILIKVVIHTSNQDDTCVSMEYHIDG